MKIGELARLTATPIQTIRFYEREQLLPEAKRTDANYRIYDDGDAKRLSFIRHCRSLDMALDEIRTLLRFKDQPKENCGGVNEVLDQHIVHVANRIRQLRALEKQLRSLREECSHARAASECGILRELAEATPAQPMATRSQHVSGAHERTVSARGPS